MSDTGLPKAEYMDISHGPPNDQNLPTVHLRSDFRKSFPGYNIPILSRPTDGLPKIGILPTKTLYE